VARTVALFRNAANASGAAVPASRNWGLQDWVQTSGRSCLQAACLDIIVAFQEPNAINAALTYLGLKCHAARPFGRPMLLGTPLGYARVSKGDEQTNALQMKALKAAGCRRLFEESASGGRCDRPKLHRMLDQRFARVTICVGLTKRSAISSQTSVVTM
jgi:hypothetical protein